MFQPYLDVGWIGEDPPECDSLLKPCIAHLLLTVRLNDDSTRFRAALRTNVAMAQALVGSLPSVKEILKQYRTVPDEAVKHDFCAVIATWFPLTLPAECFSRLQGDAGGVSERIRRLADQARRSGPTWLEQYLELRSPAEGEQYRELMKQSGDKQSRELADWWTRNRSADQTPRSRMIQEK
jgi:hypothetical protein